MTIPIVTQSRSRKAGWLARHLSRGTMVALLVVIAVAPGILFFDPFMGLRRGHIPRNPSAIYRLYSDDFAYVAASRTLSRTVANLFTPHNTHIVPAWRALTWTMVACAGSLANLPSVLAPAAYGILVAVMLMTYRLVARETGRNGLGMAAMAAVGTTSLMATPACWYSAGQTLWASFGVLATLWYAQSWRRSVSPTALVFLALAAALAGWFWTIGYLAGPVAAVYLLLDGRYRCRLAAAIPLFASLLALGTALVLGGKEIDSTVSLHGRTPRQAARPVAGLFHTAQAIPENLVLENLGLKTRTTPAQGMAISLTLIGAWAFQRGRSRGIGGFRPLECAGLALALGSYFVEWTVRGYEPFHYWRTVNLGMVVPWYDVVPQVGAVLFVVGWCAGAALPSSLKALVRPVRPPSRLEALGIISLIIVLFVLNKPRVDMLWRNWVPALSATEESQFPTLSLQSMRAHMLLLGRADWQRRHLKRLDQAEAVGSRMGIGRDGVRAAFGRLDMPELPDVYDAAGLLDLPDVGRLTDVIAIRQALGPYVFKESEPRPPWLSPHEPWPPRDRLHYSETDVDDSE